MVSSSCARVVILCSQYTFPPHRSPHQADVFLSQFVLSAFPLLFYTFSISRLPEEFILPSYDSLYGLMV